MAKRHMLRIKKDYFDLMDREIKTLDVRVGYPDIIKINEGDIVSFENYEENCFDVVKIRRYNDFADMLDHENSQLIIPGITESEVLKTLREIYTEEKERLGVYVIEYKKHRFIKDKFKLVSVADIAHKNRLTFSNIIGKIYVATDSICTILPKHFNWYWNKVVPGILSDTHEILACTIDKKIVGVVILERKNKKGEICAFISLDEYSECEILTYLVKESFNFLKTNKPHMIIPDHKLNVFNEIITKYSWKKTNEFLPGYYKDSSKALIFN